MQLVELEKEITSSLEILENEYTEHGLSSYLPQLTFYKIHGLTEKENFHSKFITFLLNPKKQHDCGNNFLKLFIDILNDKIKSENLKLSSLVLDDYKEAKAEAGSISGGRVDIRLFNTDKNRSKNIIIENKINAGDQWAQLARYYKDYPCSTIVYLTLLGKSASSYSLNYQNKKLDEKDYLIISYKEDIRKWLNQCQNYLHDENCKLDIERKNKISILINDYLTVIKELTKISSINDAIFPIFSKDLHIFFKTHDQAKKLKEDNKNAKLSDFQKLCLNKVVPLKQYLVREKFINIILNNLIKDIGDGLLYKINEGKGIMQKGWGFQFYKEKWKEHNIKIGFYFKKKYLRNCNYGLRKYVPNNPNIPNKFKDNKPKNGWYKENKLDKYSDWDRYTFYEFMSKDPKETKFYESIKTIVSKMCEEID